jgi:hypothetical protein
LSTTWKRILPIFLLSGFKVVFCRLWTSFMLASSVVFVDKQRRFRSWLQCCLLFVVKCRLFVTFITDGSFLICQARSKNEYATSRVESSKNV